MLKKTRCDICIYCNMCKDPQRPISLEDNCKFFKAQYNCANCAHYDLNKKKCNNLEHPFKGEHRNPYDCACIGGFKDLY